MRRDIGLPLMVIAWLIITAEPAPAQTEQQPAPPIVDPSLGITVTATRLDEARSAIQPSLGATTYGFTPRTIGNVPLGENAPLNQVLLRPVWCRTVSGRSMCVATWATCSTGSTACSCRRACRCSTTS
jgi:hypothetical protein